MTDLESIPNNPTVPKIVSWLNSRGQRQEALLEKAAAVREQHVSKNAYFRGIIEFSNICQNDCFYCGIRRSNQDVTRFTLAQSEIMECAEFCYDAGYGSVVLQSGEGSWEKFVDFAAETVSCIKAAFPELGITLLVGEQSEETYRRFFDAGAHRYLLRMESTVPEHYRQLHPPEMDYERRKDCLRRLRLVIKWEPVS